jgi:hypothetical protein
MVEFQRKFSAVMYSLPKAYRESIKKGASFRAGARPGECLAISRVSIFGNTQ